MFKITKQDMKSLFSLFIKYIFNHKSIFLLIQNIYSFSLMRCIDIEIPKIFKLVIFKIKNKTELIMMSYQMFGNTLEYLMRIVHQRVF